MLEKKNRPALRWFLLLAVIIGLVDLSFIWFNHLETVRTELLRRARENRSAMSSATTINLRSIASSMQLQAMLLSEDRRVRSLLSQARQTLLAQNGTGNGQAEVLRTELYEEILPEWEWLKKRSAARFLHFHVMPGPRSFLRVYDPGRFGDQGLHDAVNTAVASGRPAVAFETGRVYSGIRGAAPVTGNDDRDSPVVGVVEVGAPFETLIGNLREAFAEFGTNVQLAILLRRSHLDRTMWPDKLRHRDTLNIGSEGYVVESSTSDTIRLLARRGFMKDLVSTLPGVEIVELNRFRYEVMAFEIPMQGVVPSDGALLWEGQTPSCLLVAWHPIEGAGVLELQSLRRSFFYGLMAYAAIMAAVALAWIYGSRHLRNLVRRRTAELAEANTELQRAERSYRGIYDSAIQGMFQSSLDGSYFSLNPAFVRMLGYDFPGEVNKIPNPAMQMFLGSENNVQLMEKLLHQREIQNHEAELRRKDGSTVYALSNVWLNQDESGTTYIEGIVVDHTARRLMEEKLKEEQRRLNDDLKTAAEVQLSLLPGDVPESECFHAEWRFMPSFQVSGDILNIFELDCDHLAFYVLDVSGHGVPSSLVGASASQALQPYSYFCSWSPEGPGSSKCNHPPKVVLELLNMEFPFERFDRFLTICYMVLNLRTGVLSYCNAGHPEACVLRAGGGLEVLPVKNTIIGIDRSLSFEQGSVSLAPGDKVFVYTDGVIDHRSQEGAFYGEERLMDYLRQHATVSSSDLLDNLTAELMRFGDNAEPRDDITLLAVEFLKPFRGQPLLQNFPQGGQAPDEECGSGSDSRQGRAPFTVGPS